MTYVFLASHAKRRAIWPSRAAPGLPRVAFERAIFAAPAQAESPPKPQPITVDLFSALTQMAKLVRLVGVPEMASPEAKSAVLIETAQSGGRDVVRLHFRQHRTREIVEEAASALEDLLAAFGQRVAIRDVRRRENMIGWAAVLQLAPTHAETRTAWTRSTPRTSSSFSAASSRPALSAG